jgi:hypothetical protein
MDLLARRSWREQISYTHFSKNVSPNLKANTMLLGTNQLEVSTFD